MSDEIQFLELNKLVLDEENPRLPESLDRDQKSMTDYIAETTSIEELMDVIAQNNYFIGEPLIVVPKKDAHGNITDTYVVVEGNRRLTVLKLLQNPHLAVNYGTKIQEIVINAKYKPTSIPVVVRETREEVLPYLGFRHITGIKQWEPLAKARYIEQIFAITKNDEILQNRYSEVARIIGSRSNHIRRSLEALEIYKVIKKRDFFEIEDLNEDSIKFAVLSTALADEKIAKFVGLQNDLTAKSIIVDALISSPSALIEDTIAELTKWIYEKDKKKGKTRVGESRNLRQLAAVVDNPRALAAFRNGALLKVAYLQTADVTADFLELLYQADASLVEAASIVATLDYDDEAYSVASRILENIKLIGRELKHKKSPAEDEF